MPKLEVVNANNVIEFNPQKANFKLKNTGGPKGEPGAQGPKGDTGATGATGPAGPAGAAATIAVGTTTTGAEGTNASVTNSGTSSAAVFNFTIPKGDTGATGATGATGPQGPAGQDGADGFSPIATVTQEGLDAEISITDKDGTTTATVPGFGVQVVESLPATGSSNVIYLERDSNSASGNPISIADAVQAPLKSLDIQGNTAQQTYTGKNLYPLIASTTNNGITYTQNADGTYNISGTSTAQANASFWLYDISGFESGQTYTISVSPTPTNLAAIVEVYNGDTWVRNGNTATAWTRTQSKVLDLTGANRLKFTFRVEPNLSVNLQNFKVQFEKGSSATEWERYVGGKASPNPDYPQAVQTVTGENVVKITGKNLANIPDFNITQGSSYNISSLNKTVSVSSTTSNVAISLSSGINGGSWLPAYNASSVVDHHITSVGGTYILSLANVTKTISGSQALYVTIYTNKRAVSNTSLTSSSDFTPSAITLDSDEYIKDIWIWLGGSSTYNASFNMQLELGSTATAYEPYQEQSYEVNLGKNLFDKDNASTIGAYIAGGTSTIVTDGANTSIYIPCQPNTTYTISKMADNVFRAGTTSVIPANGAAVKNMTDNASGTKITLTSASDAKYIVVFIRNNASSHTVTELMASLQVEKGSTATSYAAYFEPIELCKIGDYQDSIYKSGGKWYVHKEIKRRNLADYKDLGWWASGSHVVKINWTLLGDSDFVKPTNKDTLGFMVSDYFTNTTANNLYNGIVNTGCAIGDDGLYFSNNDWSANTFKTFITDNTVYIYNPLATPTDTEITNEALIAQLEAILNGGTQGGANTITLTPSAWATGTLEVEYYDSYDSYLWVNNRWEKFAHLG